MIHRRLLLGSLLAIVVVALLVWVSDRWSWAQARAAAGGAAGQALQTHGALLESELQKFRLLPLVLIEYPDVAAALSGDRAARGRLDRTLELLAARTDAADLYVIRPDGETVAASNWRKPTSFVGQNYGFRPYFRDAMRGGAAELFALGTVSRRPGLYLARRVDRGGQPLGVVVVKVEFDAVEDAWARTAGTSFVTDANGVILVTSLPDWRFQTIGAVRPAAIAAARRALQFGEDALRPAPVTLSSDGDAVVATGIAEARYRVTSSRAPLAGGKLYHIAPLEGPLAAARAQALLLGLGMLFVLAAGAMILLRAAETRRLEHRARLALEEEVARRTTELSEANTQLIVESNQRVEADRRYRAAREELAQASRLGTLGQVTAGVAHEINQPVAAIRTFAENAATFLDRAAPDKASANLKHIVSLTERIGTITSELRAFARRKTPGEGRAELGSVLDGALLLLGERARGVVTLKVPKGLRQVAVRGDRIRLEQILINLLQNALDAVQGAKEGRIVVEGVREGDTVRLSVIDNGPGVPAEIADTLFTPFTSAKEGGLGLGLAIARDIAREFGGDIAHAPAPGGGAAFRLSLRVA